ncbi:hypothetical protein F8388_003842 [Cannabis sativa]|uniref:Uncharacterized protein n=1 Tax=Cannabis sativa TaxID=3483 RepID=A0A7J6GNM7_CANSA|nr:hypothetical protein F8388_003842 [Cannabis sativa]
MIEYVSPSCMYPENLANAWSNPLSIFGTSIDRSRTGIASSNRPKLLAPLERLGSSNRVIQSLVRTLPGRNRVSG